MAVDASFVHFFGFGMLLLRITSSSGDGADGDRSIAAVGAAFTIDSDGGHYSHFGVTSGDFFLASK